MRPKTGDFDTTIDDCHTTAGDCGTEPGGF